MAAEIPMYLLLLVVLPLLIYYSVVLRRRPSGGRVPPGPWALPVIGHLHHLAGAVPHRGMRELSRRHGPVMSLRLCQLPAVVASSAAAAREVMRTHDVAFSSRPLSPTMQMFLGGSEGIVFAPYGDGWRQLRKICTLELLSARRVHSFRPIREDVLGELLRSVAAAAAAAAPVDMTKRISTFVADSSVQAMLGRCSSADRATLFGLLEEGFKIIPGMTLPDLFPSSRLAMLVSRVPGKIAHRNRRMHAFMDSVIRQHREKRAAATAAGKELEHEDLLDVLLRLQEDMKSQYPLTTDNIKLVIIDMISASSETTSTTMVWAMAELLRNPAALWKAQEEVRRELGGRGRVTEDGLTNLHYLRLVIKETLRLHPPLVLLFRQRSTPCEVLGFEVPRDTMVVVNAWAIGRDPALWDSPEEFVPERFEDGGRDFKGLDFEYLPFGAGRRICPGVTFGLVHLELALAALLFHFDWKLPDGMRPEEMDMTEEAGLTIRRLSHLVVFAAPRVPLPAE